MLQVFVISVFIFREVSGASAPDHGRLYSGENVNPPETPGSSCDDEKPGKGEQQPSVRHRRIVAFDAPAIGCAEGITLVRFDRGQIGPEPCSFDPVDNRLRIRHRVIVDRVPDLDAGRHWHQTVDVGRRSRSRLPLGTPPGKDMGPGAIRCRFVHRPVARLAQIIGHLDCQKAAGRQPFHQGGKYVQMSRHPLKDGIGIEKVRRRVRAPGGEVGLDEGRSGQARPCFRQHVVVAVEAADGRQPEALDKKLGRIARPAAEIDHVPGNLQRHPRKQIPRRPRPLILETEILRRRPVHAGTSTRPESDDNTLSGAKSSYSFGAPLLLIQWH